MSLQLPAVAATTATVFAEYNLSRDWNPLTSVAGLLDSASADLVVQVNIRVDGTTRFSEAIHSGNQCQLTSTSVAVSAFA